LVKAYLRHTGDGTYNAISQSIGFKTRRKGISPAANWWANPSSTGFFSVVDMMNADREREGLWEYRVERGDDKDDAV
jgi:hypothetical protein